MAQRRQTIIADPVDGGPGNDVLGNEGWLVYARLQKFISDYLEGAEINSSVQLGKVHTVERRGTTLRVPVEGLEQFQLNYVGIALARIFGPLADIECVTNTSAGCDVVLVVPDRMPRPRARRGPWALLCNWTVAIVIAVLALAYLGSVQGVQRVALLRFASALLRAGAGGVDWLRAAVVRLYSAAATVSS